MARAGEAAMVEGRTATMQLYGSFWSQKGSTYPKTAAITLSLKQLAEVHNRTVNPVLLAGYIAPLEDLSQQEIILAFSRAHDEEAYWPTPARLRGLSGREPVGDPVEREAIAALNVVLAKMRSFGWELKPKTGKIIRTDSPEGRLLEEPLREPTTYPNLPARSMMTLSVLGWGDHQRGLALLKDHPAVSNALLQDSDFKANQLKQADELKRRWVEAYRQRMGAGASV